MRKLVLFQLFLLQFIVFIVFMLDPFLFLVPDSYFFFDHGILGYHVIMYLLFPFFLIAHNPALRSISYIEYTLRIIVSPGITL